MPLEDIQWVEDKLRKLRASFAFDALCDFLTLALSYKYLDRHFSIEKTTMDLVPNAYFECFIDMIFRRCRRPDRKCDSDTQKIKRDSLQVTKIAYQNGLTSIRRKIRRAARKVHSYPIQMTDMNQNRNFKSDHVRSTHANKT